jgi:hypothetical protein
MKTTVADFKYFRARCNYWINKLELNCYTTCYEHKELGNCNAKMLANALDCTCTIGLNLIMDHGEFQTEMTKAQALDRYALHECIHLLLHKLSWFANTRYVSEEILDSAEEEIVIKLSKLLSRI